MSVTVFLVGTKIEQESPPAWTQEAHRPPRSRSKYLLFRWGGVPPQTWDGVPPPSKVGVPPQRWGTPFQGWGTPPPVQGWIRYPPCPRLDWVPPPPVQGWIRYPHPPIQGWIEYPPPKKKVWTDWNKEFNPKHGVPPPPGCGLTNWKQYLPPSFGCGR